MNPVAQVRLFVASLLLMTSAVAQTNVIERFPAEGFRTISVSTNIMEFNGQITVTWITNEVVWFRGTNDAKVHTSLMNTNKLNTAEEKFNAKVTYEKVPNNTPAPGWPPPAAVQPPNPGRL